MTPRQILQVLIEKASDADIVGVLFDGIDYYFVMVLVDTVWLRVSYSENRVVFTDMNGEHHSPNITHVKAVKVTYEEDFEKWNPPVTHKTNVDHNMGFNQHG